MSRPADGGERLSSYWQPPMPEDVRPAPDQIEEQMRTELEHAVARQLVADVPVGVFLSGGLDSSTLSALAQKSVGGGLQTFSVGFAGPGAVSELPAAREIAVYLGSHHHELMMNADEVADGLEKIIDGLDAPLGDPTVIPTWFMSRFARERVTVVLSGEGADEVFGGYARQRYDVAIDWLGAAGRRLLPPALRVMGRKPSARLSRGQRASHPAASASWRGRRSRSRRVQAGRSPTRCARSTCSPRDSTRQPSTP